MNEQSTMVFEFMIMTLLYDHFIEGIPQTDIFVLWILIVAIGILLHLEEQDNE